MVLQGSYYFWTERNGQDERPKRGMGEFAEKLAAHATARKEVGKEHIITRRGEPHTECKADLELAAVGHQDLEEH